MSKNWFAVSLLIGGADEFRAFAKADSSGLALAIGTVPGWEDSRNFLGCLLRKCPAGFAVPPLLTYCLEPKDNTFRKISHKTI